MYDWVTTTTVDNTGEFSSIQYIVIYEAYTTEEPFIYNKIHN
jgi:hypothetical protein